MSSLRRPAVLCCVLALLLLSVLPVGITLSRAFTDTTPEGGTTFTLRWLGTAFDAPGPDPLVYVKSLGNSVLVSGVAALLSLLIGVPFALLTARTDVPGRTFFASVYATPLVLPPLLLAIAWTEILGAPGPNAQTPADASPLLEGGKAVLRAGTLFALGTFPLVVLFVRRALADVPAEAEESARLVAGPLGAVRAVTLPLVMPSALAGAAFVFLFALHDFSLIDYLNWVRPLPQQITVYPFKSFGAFARDEAPGAATAAGIPLGIASVLLLFVVLRVAARSRARTVSGAHRTAAPFALGPWKVPATAFLALVLAVAVAVPVVSLARLAGSVGAFERAFRIVAGPESSSHDVAWSLWLGGAAAVLAIVPAFLLGHHASRRGGLGPALLSFLPLALPPVFLGIGALRLWNHEVFQLPLPGGGVRNPFVDVDGPRLGAILLLWAKYLPFAVSAAWTAVDAVDPRLEEAAATAGVRPADRLLGITVPLVAPALALGAVLVLVFSLREIDTIVLLSTDTLMRRIYSMVHLSRDQQVAALALVLLVLEILPFVLAALLLPRKRTGAGTA